MRPVLHILAASVFVAASVSPVYAGNDEAGPERIFGMLPNNTTIEPSAAAAPQTTRDAFTVATRDTFDPVIYPFVGVTTLLGSGGGRASYNARYATAFADSTIGNFMTTAVMPSLTNQDSRYYRRGEGGVFGRIAYAASRTVVTRSREGRAMFNISEIGGNFVAAGLSNVYYTPEGRTVGATMSRWGTQVMWDTVANELKEFWPDIHRRLRK